MVYVFTLCIQPFHLSLLFRTWNAGSKTAFQASWTTPNSSIWSWRTTRAPYATGWSHAKTTRSYDDGSPWTTPSWTPWAHDARSYAWPSWSSRSHGYAARSHATKDASSRS